MHFLVQVSALCNSTVLCRLVFLTFSMKQILPSMLYLPALLSFYLSLLKYFLFKSLLSNQWGFFKRSKQDDSVPRHHAVRVKKETPGYVDGKAEPEVLEKKQWMTTWIDSDSFL
ncbi:hypothetical protein CHARACLAT_001329 [Characodon lateralis]|uniref:Uncharacterized protein n=1 Tax=Characodon lateralis TaxID=208331 RepID=A0ABU7DMD4_9TELE|nr:hypothetical protein [Characodon lateralis]